MLNFSMWVEIITSIIEQITSIRFPLPSLLRILKAQR